MSSSNSRLFVFIVCWSCFLLSCSNFALNRSVLGRSTCKFTTGEGAGDVSPVKRVLKYGKQVIKKKLIYRAFNSFTNKLWNRCFHSPTGAFCLFSSMGFIICWKCGFATISRLLWWTIEELGVYLIHFMQYSLPTILFLLRHWWSSGGNLQHRLTASSQ